MEEAEGPKSGSAGSGATNASGVDPLSTALALNGASREKADAFLDDQRSLMADQRGHIADQRRMLHLQMEELQEENPLKLSHLRVRRFADYAKMAFEFSVGLLMLATVSGLGLMVWNAVHAQGLIVEPFSVPPELANRGITGQVVASQMLDNLITLQNSTQSARPGKSYTNSWGDDLKVEIPDTGVSVGEAYRFLRRWLGHETHVSGEVIRTPNGIAITARADGNGGATFLGPESNLDALVVQSAEKIYRVTQPDRYARYLFFPRPGLTRPRFDEARAILSQMVRDAAPSEKRWAWNGLAVLARYQGDYRTASIAYRKAAAESSLSTVGLGVMETELSHPEFALSTARMTRDQLDSGTYEVDPSFLGLVQTQNSLVMALLSGDYNGASILARTGLDVAGSRSLGGREFNYDTLLYTLARQHDGAAMRAYWGSLPPPDAPLNNAQRTIAYVRAEGALENYRVVVASEPNVEKVANAVGDGFTFKDVFEIQLRPLVALAKAKLGDIAGAQALIAQSPGDCYDCIRIRGQVAELAKQSERADYWFARAAKVGPSIPFAYTDWGQALLTRGQPDAAIEKFTIANQKGPHFADPLEGWGEALMAKNQSHLALAKFKEAEKYAPNWGRLHLKWGEALVYAGKKDEAKAQFARAVQLDLTPSEKSELARHP